MSNPRYKDIGRPETIAIEKCSDLIQALCKADRFGWFSPHSGSTNMGVVMREMGGVLEAMNRLDIHLRELIFERFKKEVEK